MAGGYLPYGLAPSGELTAYTPTLRERASDWLRQKLFTDDRAGQDKANRLMDVASVTPFGFAMDAYDAGRAGGQGNYGQAVGTSLAIFAGPMAKTADHAALKLAKKLDKADVNPKEIWDKTGWFKGADSKWRFEIDDSAYRSNPDALAATGRIAQADAYLQSIGSEFRLGDPRLSPSLQKEALAWADRPAGKDATIPLTDYMQHPEFQAAYPDNNVMVGRQSGVDYNGSHVAGTNVIRTGGGSISRFSDPRRDSTALHELQHWIQEKEGFAPGGNPHSIFGHSDPVVRRAVEAEHKKLMTPPSWEEWSANPTWHGVPAEEVRAQYDKAVADAKVINRNVYHPINKSAQETASKNIYKRLAGETEARNVQARMDMTAEQRRAEPPWWTQDYPFVDQIVRRSRQP